jgi:LacI family transcriptional regulator
LGSTSFDVARAAGVSQPTVSRALRDDPNVAAETRERVHRVARELGYVTSERGRSLSTRSTQRVAMVVDLDNPLWSLLVRGLHNSLARVGLRLSLVAGRGDQHALEAQLLGGGIDGVIMSTVTLASNVPKELDERGVPLVLLNRYTESRAVDASVADDYGGGELAGRVLLEAGHRRLGAVFGPEDTSTGRGRAAGFRAALDAAGITLPDAWTWTGPFDYAHGRTAVLDLFDRRDRPTALFCANDVIAIGVIDEARRLGLSIPEDLAVVGFDDLEEAAWASFDLTTVRVPFGPMLDTAVRLLVERMSGKRGKGEAVVHPVSIAERSSHLLGSTPSPRPSRSEPAITKKRA